MLGFLFGTLAWPVPAGGRHPRYGGRLRGERGVSAARRAGRAANQLDGETSLQVRQCIRLQGVIGSRCERLQLGEPGLQRLSQLGVGSCIGCVLCVICVLAAFVKILDELADALDELAQGCAGRWLGRHNRRAGLLDNVGKLVCEYMIALGGAWLVLVLTEDDVVADRERARPLCLRRRGGLRAHM